MNSASPQERRNIGEYCRLMKAECPRNGVYRACFGPTLHFPICDAITRVGETDACRTAVAKTIPVRHIGRDYRSMPCGQLWRNLYVHGLLSVAKN